MGIVRPSDRAPPKEGEDADPVARFSRGEIGRRQAQHELGDIGYSELLDRIAERGLPLPQLPPEEIERMARDFLEVLAKAGR